MKAGVIYNTGDIRYDDFPDPTCGADDIIVRVAACGICGSDSPRILSGWKYPLPGVPGHEFSGTVVEVGKNVRKFHVGDNVAVQDMCPCVMGHRCWGQICRADMLSTAECRRLMLLCLVM